jgi:branched-chain amino acid transport system substrate-binding protein
MGPRYIGDRRPHPLLLQSFLYQDSAHADNNQAGGYSAALQYLKAVNAIGSKDPDKVFAYLKTQKFEDATTRNGVLRFAGRIIRDMYLVRAKKPADSKDEWDFYDVVATIPGVRRSGAINQSERQMLK